MVEAVIVLTFLGVVLIGLCFVGRAQSRALDAQALARRCAFERALAGCRGEPPASCTRAIEAPREAPGDAGDPLRRTAAEHRGAALLDVLELPLIADAIDALGTERTAARVDFREGDSTGMHYSGSARLELGCNEVLLPPRDLVERTFEALRQL